MFRKHRIQMTIFSTIITSAILIVMAMACMFISENSTYKNSFSTFSNNAASCIFHMESQTLISHKWISQAQKSYGIQMKIQDNGNALFFDKLHPAKEVQANTLKKRPSFPKTPRESTLIIREMPPYLPKPRFLPWKTIMSAQHLFQGNRVF